MYGTFNFNSIIDITEVSLPNIFLRNEWISTSPFQNLFPPKNILKQKSYNVLKLMKSEGGTQKVI